MADIDFTDPEIQKAIKVLFKSIGGASVYQGGYASFKSKDDSGVDVRRLKNLMDNNSNYLQQMGDMYKKMLLSSKKLDDVFNVLEKSSRSLDKKQRQTMLSVVDVLKDIQKQGKDVSAGFEKINQTLRRSKKSYEVMNDLASSTKKLSDLEKARQDAEARLKSVKKSKGANSKGAKAAAERVKDIKADVFRQRMARKNAEDTFKKVSSGIGRSFKDFNKLAQVLTDEELDYIKNLENINAADQKYIKIINKLRDSQILLTEANQSAADVMAARSQRAAESFEGAVHSLKQSVLTAGKLLLTRGVPLAFHDFMNRMKYNIPESNYSGSIAMGITESERSQFIGENRTNLRAMGNGSEYTGFDKGLNSLQNTAYQFGVYGKDALALALSYQKTGMNLGISGNNITGQKAQMTQMHLMSEQIGVTDEALKEFYDSLNDMGQMASLYSKYSDKSESERTKAINKEIYERTKLNTALGVSLDMQKRQQQEATNKQYAGIESMIKSNIGSQMAVDIYNKTNPNAQISEDDKKFFANINQAGGPGNLNDKNAIKRYNDIAQKLAIGDKKNLADAQQAAYNGDPTKLLTQGAYNVMLSHANFDRQAFDNENANAAKTRASYNGQAVTGNKSYAAIFAEASTKLDGPDGFTAGVINATQALKGLAQSPIGGSTGALFDGLKGFVLKGLADKWLGPMFAQLAERKGAAGLLGKAGSFVFNGAAKASPMNLLEMSPGQILKGGAKWLGRGLLGGIGAWGINKFLGGSETLSAGNNDIGSKALRGTDNLADYAMSSGFVPAMAVGAAWKGGARIGNAAYNQLSKSSTFNDMSDILFGSTFGAANAIFNGDNSGLNVAKSSTIDLSNKVRHLFGMGDWDKNSLPSWVTSGTGYSPSQAVNKSVSDADKQEAERDQDEVKGHLAEIAKNTKTAAEEAKKQNSKDQNPEDAKGNIYAFYRDHLNNKHNGLET